MLLISPDNEYPKHIGDLKLAHPDWEEGNALPSGWQEVAYASELPDRGENEVIYEVEPTPIDGVLTQTFSVRPMTTEEIERRDAPKTLKAKLTALGLTEAEIDALTRGIGR